MAEIIRPKDLNPEFLKKIEDTYGKVDMEYDYFDPDLSTYYKTDPSYKSEGGGKKRDVINLPTLNKLYSDLGKARNTAKDLKTKKELRNDTKFQSQADDVVDTFNSFRTFFRTNYPDQYAMAKRTVKETMGMAYNTPYAFGKANTSQYTSIGYKPVNQKALRKKSKGTDYIDLYKD
jgi:hypothetical protein